jgi:proliferating cell nuclear antigen PCNA
MATTTTTTCDVLSIKTMQIAPFKTLIAALKEILLETNIIFTKEGMSINSMDKSHTSACLAFLYAKEFEEFETTKNKIIIGVNMTHLNKLVSTIDNNDTLTIYIDPVDYADGVVKNLSMKLENVATNQSNILTLRLIEPEEQEEDFFPDVKFSSIINLPSAGFHKIIRDMSSISEKIEISTVGNEIIFRSDGVFASSEIHRVESGEGGMKVIADPGAARVIQGVFSLKNLGYFIKCTPLCQHIEIYLENDLPLVVKYNVASLGYIKLCLCQLPF